MSIVFATEPAGSRVALAEGLSALGAAATPTSAAHFAAVSGAAAAPPLPVYFFSLDELAAGRDPRNVSPVAWKYLLVCGSVPVRSADVMSSANGGFEFAAISEAEAAAINNAIETAESDPLLANRDYEMRLALIPALYVTALWLKDTIQGQDRFVVIPPTPSGFVAFSIHTAADFLKALQTAATQKQSSTPVQMGMSPPN